MVLSSTVVLWCLVAHALADWHWQTPFVTENKGRRYVVMFMHCLGWAGCIGAVLSFFGLFSIYKFLFLFFGHWVIDKWKCWVLEGRENKLCNKAFLEDPAFVDWAWRMVYVDQALHMVQLLIVCYV